MYRPAKFADFVNAPRHRKSFLSKEEAFQVPEGHLFLLNNNRWYLKTTPELKEIQQTLKKLEYRHEEFRQQKTYLKGYFTNLLSIRYEGHLISSFNTLIPEAKAYYYSHSCGNGTEYTAGTVSEGETFENGQEKYLCLYKSIYTGNPYHFGDITFFAVRI